MNWLERLVRLERKARRETIKRNVRAFRRRQEKAGIRRIEIALNAEQYSALVAVSRPGEAYSETVARLLISGNSQSALKAP
jgi:hypothetical protein